MKKKIIIIAASIILLVLVLILGFYLINKNDKKFSEVFEAIPSEAAMIIEINDPISFMEIIKSDNSILSNFANIINLNPQKSILHYCDSVGIFSMLYAENMKSHFSLSFHPEGANPFSQLLIFKLNESDNIKSISKEFNNSISNFGVVSERDFNETTIFEFKHNGNLPNIHFSFANGLAIMSFSPKLVEKSIEQLHSETSILSLYPDLNSIYSTAGKKEIANVYINMKYFADAISQSKAEKYSNFFSSLQTFSTWTELDFSAEDMKISFNGFSKITDSSSNFISILNSQESTSFRSIEVLPSNTAMYLSLSFNNVADFDKALANYQILNEKNTARNTELNEILSTTGIDIKESFYSIIDNEVTFAITSPGTYDLYENSFVIFGLKSQSAALLEIENILNHSVAKMNRSVNDFQRSLRIDANTSVDMFILPFEGLPALLFGDYFGHCTGKYVCCVNNFMVFANSKDALFKFVYEAELNNTLKTSIEHNLFLENFSQNSNMFLYFSMFNAYEILNDLFNDSTSLHIADFHDEICNIGNIGYQINKSNDMLYNNFVVQHSDNIIEKPQTVWESRLDTTVASKPSLVVNHNNSSKEIIIQDEKNILYLLSNSGREVWRLNLNEKITSKIYQVDLYKNGKLQYLFSTKKEIHAIDRLGNYVDKYPIKLRSPATGPMSLFDYDNKLSYRMVIPCKDNKLYLYNGEGSIVKGWKFESTENSVASEINHYKIANEDFIVFNDDYKAYFISRTGESKLNFLTKFKFSNNNKIWLDNKSAKPRFIATDEKGIVRCFYTDGKQDSIKMGEFSQNHFFAVEDVNRDGSNDFVFVDENRMEVYDKSKKLILSYDFPTNVTSPPVFYSFPRNQTKIGIVCSSGYQIYLINHDGSLFNGFPLFGLTAFSIGFLNNESNKFNLIVGGQDNLLYNYEVNEN